MNKYTVEDVVKSSTFKIESSDVVFIEEVKGALGINKLAEMKDLRKKIEHFKIVFDIESGDNVKRYVSDGNIVCQIERDYCNKLDYELKDIFDPLYLIQLKD
ncbi:MAG: hypothetical protein HWE07_06425 [Cytophagia bacterium]|nr:hypothetical protein [Cytophagia bacterium]